MRRALASDLRERPAADDADVLFPPPEDAAALYVGPVMHARLKPFGHRFRYNVAAILVDLDRLDGLRRLSPLISHNRFNLFAVYDRDLGASDGTAPRAHVDRLLREAGLARPARLMLLTYPRVAGYVFNPLSVYFAYGAGGALTAVVYEVSNTFGDRHSYVAPVAPGELGTEGLKQSRDKLFHVSPFLDLAMRYHFRVRPPGDTVALRILETDQDGPILSATFHGTRESLTTAALARLFVGLPFLTLKIMGGIHWEALKLWLKGARYHPRPEPPVEASFRETDGARGTRGGMA